MTLLSHSLHNPAYNPEDMEEIGVLTADESVCTEVEDIVCNSASQVRDAFDALKSMRRLRPLSVRKPIPTKTMEEEASSPPISKGHLFAFAATQLVKYEAFLDQVKKEQGGHRHPSHLRHATARNYQY